MTTNLVATIKPTRLALSRVAQEGSKYFLVSVAALTVDSGLLIALTELGGFHYLVSAAIGFCAGLVANYVLSVRFVFKTRSVSKASVEFAWFCVIGFFGLLLNEVVIAVGVERIGLSYILAKGVAAAFSFLFNFGVRRWLLFSSVRRPATQSR